MLDAHAVTLSPAETFILNVSLLAIIGWSMWKAEKTLTPGNDAMVLVLLGVFAVSGRVLLEPLPNVQPVTVIVLLAGVHYGAARSTVLATSIALISNIFLGHGIWTLYQAAGWSLVGIAGALLSDRMTLSGSISVSRVAALSVAAAFLFGWVVSLSALHSFGAEMLPVYIISGIPFDILHASGNVFFVAWLSNPMSEIMSRHNTRRTVVRETVALRS
jgi:energy-coupling factor transport system substrate-specific component|tara:strand:+ start:1982 stop:2632 length:651 start_codon:yes stop_codon:yes gene_type:complete